MFGSLVTMVATEKDELCLRSRTHFKYTTELGSLGSISGFMTN